jgi:hypothetical protein
MIHQKQHLRSTIAAGTGTSGHEYDTSSFHTPAPRAELAQIGNPTFSHSRLLICLRLGDGLGGTALDTTSDLIQVGDQCRVTLGGDQRFR